MTDVIVAVCHNVTPILCKKVAQDVRQLRLRPCDFTARLRLPWKRWGILCRKMGFVTAGRLIRDAVVFRVVDLEDVYKWCGM